MKLAFFISDHGYGHIMRNLPVIKKVIEDGNSVTVVTGKRQMEVARQHLGDGFEGIVCNTDAGLVVKAGSLVIDREETVKCVENHIAKWDEYIEMVADLDVDCYVVDIVPWALLAAKKYNIKAYLMINFTWIIQYKDFLPEKLLDRYYEAYRAEAEVLMYDFANEPAKNLFVKHTDVGLVARPFNADEVEKIGHISDKKKVFMSLGASNSGLDFDIDVSNLPYHFFVTTALKVKGDNVTYLPMDIPNSQDYVAASDICIAKAGWSTLAEILIAGCKAVFIERKDTPEDTATIAELLNRGDAISFDVSELKDIGALLHRIENSNLSIKPGKYCNSCDIIAGIVGK